MYYQMKICSGCLKKRVIPLSFKRHYTTIDVRNMLSGFIPIYFTYNETLLDRAWHYLYGDWVLLQYSAISATFTNTLRTITTSLVCTCLPSS